MLPFRYTFQKLHVEETLKALARFHASSIWYEETEGKIIGDEFKDILFETSLCDIPWCHAGLKVHQPKDTYYVLFSYNNFCIVDNSVRCFGTLPKS